MYSPLRESFVGLWNGIIGFIPNLVIAIVLLCIGWAIGVIVAKAISQFMKTIKFDEALRKAGFEDIVRRSGLNLNSGHFIGSLFKYFIITATLIACFNFVGLDEVTKVLSGLVVDLMPSIIVGVLILLVGVVVGDVLSRIVSASAKTAGLTSANFLGVTAKWVVWVFALLLALEKFHVSGPIVQTLFTGFVVAFSLALGLAFGLGGQDAAAKTIEKVKQSISHN